MGCFFLYNKKAKLSIREALTVLTKKGFAEPRQINLGEWCLVLYKKILLAQDNSIEDEIGRKLFCVGTFVYKGMNSRESLKRAFADWCNGSLDQSKMLGTYCLILWDCKIVSILLDPAGAFHVFHNLEGSCFSSSFLALVAASPVRQPLNRLALCEKLSTGYIVPPDTLVSTVQQVDKDTNERIKSHSFGLKILPALQTQEPSERKCGSKKSIEKTVEELRHHFTSLDALHSELGGELGISSGYDSRLLLSCARYLSTPMALHTHSTKGVHDKEAAIVRQLARTKNLHVKEVNTLQNEALSPVELDQMLDSCLYFYDGRCSQRMGSYSQTYTKDYKIRSLGDQGLSWNGLGGELFRNYYCVSSRKLDLRKWMDRYVYYPFACEVWGDHEEYEEMHKRKIEKISRQLCSNVPYKTADFFWIRRYYGKVRMPDCDAVHIQAANQLKFFHAPFMDPLLVAEAIAATRYIGVDGSYQARLTQILDPTLASVNTHYGHPLTHVPVRRRFKSFAKASLPLSLQQKRIQETLRRTADKVQTKESGILTRTEKGREIYSTLRELLLNDDWKLSLVHYAQRPTSISVAHFLTEFQHKLKIR